MVPRNNSSKARTRCRLSRNRQQNSSWSRCRIRDWRKASVSTGLRIVSPEGRDSAKYRRASSGNARNMPSRARPIPLHARMSDVSACNSARRPPKRCSSSLADRLAVTLLLPTPIKATSNSASLCCLLASLSTPHSVVSGISIQRINLAGIAGFSRNGRRLQAKLDL